MFAQIILTDKIVLRSVSVRTVPDVARKLVNVSVPWAGKVIDAIDHVMKDFMEKIVHLNVIVTMMEHVMHKLASALVVPAGLVINARKNVNKGFSVKTAHKNVNVILIIQLLVMPLMEAVCAKQIGEVSYICHKICLLFCMLYTNT